MAKAILVFNVGSSSIKFAVYRFAGSEPDLKIVCNGQVDSIGIDRISHFTVKPGPASMPAVHPTDEQLSVSNHDDAIELLLNWIRKNILNLDLVAVGHRVVHGGPAYSEPVILDSEVLAYLDKLVPLAPLHQPHNIAVIKALRQVEPELVQMACFDTAFHRTMPPVAQTFALPRALTAEGVRPYGFHGLSYEYIAKVLSDYQETPAKQRVIAAHLGHGASLCAMAEGQSVATTMSFTPLDGLPMATRCGSIDPGVVLYLIEHKQMSTRAVAELLNDQSGLLGVSGVSGDMRELLSSDEPNAREAIDLFVYRVARELGSLAAAMGGLDALVFTGGIGEHSAVIRERIAQRAAWLGITIDQAGNRANGPRISSRDSPVAVWVIPANEELVIARHVYNLAGL